MLQMIFGPAAVRRLQEQIPDVELLPNGGVWGQRMATVDASHDELTELDENVSVAANILAQGANNEDTYDRPTTLFVDRAFRFKQSRRLGQLDIQAMARVLATRGQASLLRQEALNRAARIVKRNREGVEITRGILCASAALGSFNWRKLGFQQSSTDFGMPQSLRFEMGQYLQNSDGTANVNATLIKDLVLVDRAVEALGEPKYTDIDMTWDQLMAFQNSNEFKNQAVKYTINLATTSLPIPGTDAATNLAGLVLGKRIHIVEDHYRVRPQDGSADLTKNYTPPEQGILWRSTDGVRAIGLDFANVEVTESGVAMLMGSDSFGGGIVRGPVSYTAGDSQEYTNARFLCVQEGIGRRLTRAATATLTLKNPV